MRILAPSTVDEIDRHLVALGARNHLDNMEQVRLHPRHYRVEMDEPDLWHVVFLENGETRSLTQAGGGRALHAVAAAAQQSKSHRLGDNWDLAIIREGTANARGGAQDFQLPGLLLRDSRDGEQRFGAWYLQDGSHRALGYALALLDRDIEFTPQVAFIATRHDFDAAVGRTI